MGAKSSSLAVRRQPGSLPIVDSPDRQTLGVVQHDIGRQVLVLRAQPVGDPRPGRRSVSQQSAGMNHVESRFVILGFGEHRPDQRDVVRARANVRQQFRELEARLAMSSELVRRRQNARVLLRAHCDGRQVSTWRLPRVLGQLRLRVEEIDLAWAPVHEELDHRLRLGLEVRRLRGEVKRRRGSGGSQRPAWREQVGPEQVGEPRAVQAITDAREEIAAPHRRARSRATGFGWSSC